MKRRTWREGSWGRGGGVWFQENCADDVIIGSLKFGYDVRVHRLTVKVTGVFAIGLYRVVLRERRKGGERKAAVWVPTTEGDQ